MEDMKRTTLCYIENKGAFLMLYRNRKPGDANEGKWLGIGGKIEPGETPDECNRREVLEETGLRLRTAHFHGVIHFRADEYEDEDMYLYSSDDFEPADPEAAAMYEATGEYEPPVCSEGELAWISRDKVMDLPMWEGDRAFLRKLMDGQKTISMTLRYEGEHCTIIAEDGNMNEALLRKCEFFISNLGLMRETFKWDGSELHLLGSALLTAGGIETDKDELKRCERYIKDHTNLFSPLRGNLKIAAICHMIASEDPEVYFANLERAYSIIRITRRDYDQRYYLAAVTMADVLTDKEQLLDLADRANSVFDAMRQGIGAGAGKDMYVTAATIACSDISDTDALIAEAERCHEILAKDLGDSSTVRELSYILALDNGDAALKCARLRDIMAKLEEAGISYSRGDELPMLGALAMLDLTNSEIVQYVAEADAFLRSQKGFGIYGCGSDTRHMYAAMLAMSTFITDKWSGAAAASAVLEDAMEAGFRAMSINTMAASNNLSMMLQNTLKEISGR